jgi:hypothetical protein
MKIGWVTYSKESLFVKVMVRREPIGTNLYEELEIDYRQGDLTLNDLKQILTGEPMPSTRLTVHT